MSDDIKELRDYGSAPFLPGDIDVTALQNTLKNKRKIDAHLISHLEKHQSTPGTSAITEDEAVRAFNALIDSDFYKYVDGDFLRLRPEIRRLLPLAVETGAKGQEIDRDIIRTLNRALIHAVYPEETIRCRQFERFTLPELMKMSVTISPLSPSSAEPVEGKLLNISLGGMALLLPVKLPELTYWALRIGLGDHSEVETLVQIRHSIPQQDQFVHGFQFVSIPSFLGERVEIFARDFASCEERIKISSPDVCQPTCSMLDTCTKPQRRRAA